MTLYNYESRKITTQGKFKEILDTRIEAKHNGDESLDKALKLVINTTYGAMLNKHNSLYDPLMGRSVCISGQLFLLELANNLYKNVSNLKIIQLNTDGIMVEFDDKLENRVEDIANEWQKRTGFTLEKDDVNFIVQKDVNNYIAVLSNGDIKKKGAYLVRGISKAGAFNINNNSKVIVEAVENYLLYDKPIEETINENNEILDYQIIAKASGKYSKVLHQCEDDYIQVQKVNRVYASLNNKDGQLYKVHKERNNLNLIPNLPEHCLIDNKNEASINDIDKSWYIEEAKRIAKKFINKIIESESLAMATTKQNNTYKDLNVYQKLNLARVKFLEAQVQKSGFSDYYDYFELRDIVPIATDIFNELGLTHNLLISDDDVTFRITNSDNATDYILFSTPYIQYQETKNKLMNEVQRLGATITYMRRYLYMMALDICEADYIDAHGGDDDENSDKRVEKEIPKETSKETKKVAYTSPVTQEKIRKKAKAKLTNDNKLADSVEVDMLKDWMVRVKEEVPKYAKVVDELYADTKGFTTLTSKQVEENILQAKELLGEK